MRFLLGGTEFETRSMLFFVFGARKPFLCAHALMKVMRPRSKELCFASVDLRTPRSACERCVTVACRTPASWEIADGDDIP